MKHFLILLRGALLPNRCLLGVLLAFLMVGCTEKRSEGQEEITSIVIDWDNISDNLDYSSWVEDSVLVVPLETREDCLIGTISNLIYQNHRIYVVDNMSNAVYVFDETGRLQSKVCSVGNGPKEYLGITAFAVQESRMFIYDKMKGKIMVYDENGQFIYSKDASKIWGMDMFIQGKDIYIVNVGSISDMGYYSLYKLPVAEGNDEVEAFLPFDDPGNTGWGIDRYTSASADEAMFTIWPFDVLYGVKEGEVGAVYKVDFGDRRLPEQYIKADGATALKTAIRDNYITGIEWMVQSEKRLLFSYSDAKGKMISIYDRETGKVNTTHELYNKYLGGLACSPRQLYMQDGYMISYRAMDAWCLEGELADWNYDERDFHSEYVRSMFKKFRQMDKESNPVVIIQKLKE